MKYLIISSIVLVSSFLLFKKVSGSMALARLNMISHMFYFRFVIQSFIAVLLAVNHLDKNMYISLFSDETKLYAWLCVLYTMIAVPLGMLITTIFFHIKSVKLLFDRYTFSPVQNFISRKDSYVRLFLYLLSILAIFSTIYTLLKLGHLPLLDIFKEYDQITIARFRIEASRGFEGNVYIKNIFAKMFSPVMAYIYYSYWRKTKYKKDLVWFLIMFVTTFFILTYNLAKAPLIWFLIGFMFLSILTNGRIKLRTLVSFVLLVSLIIVIMWVFIMDKEAGKELFSINYGPLRRIIFGQITGLFGYLTIFPNYHEFILGRSVSRILSTIFDFQYSPGADRIAMELLNPAAVESGTAGVMSTLFVGDAWANFGLIGVLISPIYVGILTQFLYLYFLKSNKTPIHLGLFTYLSVIGYVSAGFVSVYIYNAGLFTLILMFVIIAIFAKANSKIFRHGVQKVE